MIQWYWAKDGQQHGPFSPEDIQRMAAAGEIRPEDLLWREGLLNWVAASRVSELTFGAPKSPQAPEPQAPGPTEGFEAPERRLLDELHDAEPVDEEEILDLTDFEMTPQTLQPEPLSEPFVAQITD